MTVRRAAAAGARAHGRRLRAAGRLRAAARLPARPGASRRWRPASAARFLLFDFYNIRYTTQTWIGGALGDKMTRYALLTRDGGPALWDFGSAARHHQLYSPVARPGRLPGRHARAARRDRADRRADGGAVARDQGHARRRRRGRPAGRRGHRRAAVPVRDAAAGPARRRRPAADARRPADQVARRDHAADPGGGHGRRRLPGHRRGAEARHPRERDRRAGQQAALRDGLGPGRGDQRGLRRALQPAPAQLLRPADPPRRPGVLRHHPLLQRLPDLLLPDFRGRQRDGQRSGTRTRRPASGWTRRSPAVKAGVGTDEIAAVWPAADRVRLRQRDGGVRAAVRARARASGCTSGRSSPGSTA